MAALSGHRAPDRCGQGAGIWGPHCRPRVA